MSNIALRSLSNRREKKEVNAKALKRENKTKQNLKTKIKNSGGTSGWPLDQFSGDPFGKKLKAVRICVDRADLHNGLRCALTKKVIRSLRRVRAHSACVRFGQAESFQMSPEGAVSCRKPHQLSRFAVLISSVQLASSRNRFFV